MGRPMAKPPLLFFCRKMWAVQNTPAASVMAGGLHRIWPSLAPFPEQELPPLTRTSGGPQRGQVAASLCRPWGRERQKSTKTNSSGSTGVSLFQPESGPSGKLGGQLVGSDPHTLTSLRGMLSSKLLPWCLTPSTPGTHLPFLLPGHPEERRDNWVGFTGRTSGHTALLSQVFRWRHSPQGAALREPPGRGPQPHLDDEIRTLRADAVMG